MEERIIGSTVDGYRIQEVLGRGGMGVVYRAEDVNLSRAVAIKRINPSQADRDEFIHRFRSEAKALARIDSPYIVRVYALRETDVGLLIVMEFVDGGTLKDPLEEGRIYTPETAVPVFRQILKAFGDAHSAGVIHRDIKPQNIMLTGEGTVKVTDFGIAKMRRTDSGETVTQGGQGGTLNYMSPEQVSSIEDVDARSDLYSIGMTAYEMMAGRLPFDDMQTDFDVMRTVVEGKLPPPTEYNADIPGPLVDWIQTATAKEQADRYQGADAMLKALEDAVQRAGITPAAPEELDLLAADVGPDGGEPAAGQTVTAGETVLADDSSEDPPDDPAGAAGDDGPDDGGADAGGATVTAAPGGEEGDGTPAETDGAGGGTVMADDSPPEPDASGGGTVSAGEGDEGPAAPAQAQDPGSDASSAPWGVIGTAAAVVALAAGALFAYNAVSGGEGEGATLSVNTTPSDATVTVNDRSVGTTPVANVTVRAGTAALEIEKEGYAPFDTVVTAESGDEVVLKNVTLAPATATAEAAQDAQGGATESAATDGGGADGATPGDAADEDEAQSEPSAPADGTPAGEAGTTGADEGASTEADRPPASAAVTVDARRAVEVTVDGSRQPTGTSVAVPPGTHEVACRHPDYPEHSPITTTVRAEAGDTASVSCYFERTVDVTATGPFATVYLNGENTAQQTNAVLTLGPGEHTVELRRDGFRIQGVGHQVKRSGDTSRTSFSGSAYTLTIEPGFESVSHAVAFEVSRP